MQLPQVRMATAEDIPAVVDLIRALAEFESLPGPDDAAARRLAEHFASPAPPFGVVVADDGARLVGYALYFTTYSTFLAKPGLWLEDLFVEPAARGRGTGTSLLREVARVAAASGCGRLEWSVLDWNTGAQSFYRKLGAEVLPDWRICRVQGDRIASFAIADSP